MCVFDSCGWSVCVVVGLVWLVCGVLCVKQQIKPEDTSKGEYKDHHNNNNSRKYTLHRYFVLNISENILARFILAERILMRARPKRSTTFGGRESKEGRQTLFFTPLTPNGDISDEEEPSNDLSKLRKVHYHSGWKHTQDAVFWINLARAQDSLQFWQTRSHAVSVHRSVLAGCICKSDFLKEGRNFIWKTLDASSRTEDCASGCLSIATAAIAARHLWECVFQRQEFGAEYWVTCWERRASPWPRSDWRVCLRRVGDHRIWRSSWVRKSCPWQAFTRPFCAMVQMSHPYACSCPRTALSLLQVVHWQALTLAHIRNWLLSCSTRVWTRLALVTTWDRILRVATWSTCSFENVRVDALWEALIWSWSPEKFKNTCDVKVSD